MAVHPFLPLGRLDILEEDFGLALGDIKNFVSSTSYAYLTSVLGLDGSGSKEDWKNSQGTIGERCSTNWSDSSGRISTISSDKSTEIRTGGGSFSSDSVSTASSDLRGSLLQRKNVLNVTVPFVEENEESRNGDVVERHLNLSSLQKPVGITLHTKHDDPLCSHQLPVCRKILAKTTACPKRTPIGERRSRSVSEITEKGKTYIPLKDSPYEALIGKIAQIPVDRDFRRVVVVREEDSESIFLSSSRPKRNLKGTRTTAGICDFSHPITNPLYKVYDPKGYVKSEDELAREYIEKIGQDFNGWLASLEGDPVQLDPELLTKILRDELELPGPPRSN